MKKIFFAPVIFPTAFVQRSFVPDPTGRPQLSPLLQLYNNTKDDVVRGKGTEAPTKAKALTMTANGIHHTDLSQQTSDALLKNAEAILPNRDVDHKREHFANFSPNTGDLAKVIRLSSHPVCEAYCVMKNAYLLSNEQAIKNPDHGRAMLTCISSKVTLK